MSQCAKILKKTWNVPITFHLLSTSLTALRYFRQFLKKRVNACHCSLEDAFRKSEDYVRRLDGISQVRYKNYLAFAQSLSSSRRQRVGELIIKWFFCLLPSLLCEEMLHTKTTGKIINGKTKIYSMNTKWDCGSLYILFMPSDIWLRICFLIRRYHHRIASSKC